MYHYNRFGAGWRMALLLLSVLALVPGRGMTSNDGAGVYEGPPTPIGQGQGRAFVILAADGTPTTIGIRLTEAALDGLPGTPPPGADGWEYVLPLPAQAAGSGYDHIGIDWDPQGHAPPGVYDRPHFDFHFYLIDANARNRITAVGADRERANKMPEAAFLPAGYLLPPGTEVPRMGAHAIDPAADEFNHKPFAHSFIYGFYDGKMIFVEPMVTRAFLASKPAISTPVKLPEAYALRGYYPTRYGIRYDAERRQYDITLDGLISR